jgi:hypothetical protein
LAVGNTRLLWYHAFPSDADRLYLPKPAYRMQNDIRGLLLSSLSPKSSARRATDSRARRPP